MKKSVLVILALAVLAATLSCSEEEASDPQVNTEQINEEQISEEPVNTEEEITEEAALVDAPSAFLERCYATSINMPESRFGPENVFDNDPNTYWVTMPGAAPDEGLFFSFEEPVIINAISIQTLPGSSSIQEIALFQLYINGQQGSSYRPGEEAIPINAWVKSIFIRIDATEILNVEEYPPEDGIRYTGNLPVGISEIALLVINEQGNEVPLRVQPIRVVNGHVEASSCLEPVEAYHPDFLFDSRSEFSWTDGNKASTGEGESLTFIFDQTQRIEKIKIWNGYHRSQTHYSQNERASMISFGAESENAPVYRLADTMEPLEIILNTPLEGRSFVMDILEIHEGASYKDVVISELQFYNGEEWFVLASFDSETRKRGVLEWAENTAAAVFIDKQLFASRITSWEDYTQTLVLRSNGSFILWKHREQDGDTEIMYADGNWQIIDDNTVKIFGRLHRIGRYSQASYDPYSGVRPDQDQDLDRVTIFNDILQFDSSRISSESGLFEDFVF